MNQVTLNRGAPRTSLLAAAVLSSLALADTTPAKKVVCVRLLPNPPIDDAEVKTLLTGSVKNGPVVINFGARTILAGKKQHGPRYGAGKKVDVADALSHEFGGLLHLAHHDVQISSVDKGVRTEGRDRKLHWVN